MSADTDLTDARDAALDELRGAAAVACTFLLALRVAEDHGASADEGSAWLETKISDALENLAALTEGRPARWRTLYSADAIRVGLAIVATEARPKG
jgi:hypothetical protein